MIIKENVYNMSYWTQIITQCVYGVHATSVEIMFKSQNFFFETKDLPFTR